MSALHTWPGLALSRPHYVDGRFAASDGPEIAVVNPANEQTLALIRSVSAEDLDQAVRAARSAFAGPWSSTTADRRADLLHDLCDRLTAMESELVDDVIAETGSTVGLAQGLQVRGAIDTLRWFADAARRGPVGGYEYELPPAGDPARRSTSRILQVPAGVVAAITAYNYPLLLLARKLGAILASGCTCVVLPSPRAPLSTWRLFGALHEVGLADGVANLVIGDGEIGRRLSSHPGIDVVSFTGSVAVGRRVMKQAADTTKKVLLELGGKSPSIILPDADLPAAVAGTIARFTTAAGQGCGCTTRVFVPERDFASFTDLARETIGRMRVGDPTDPEVDMGPLITAEHRHSVESYVWRALADGGRLLAGGGRPDHERGFFLNPAVVDQVTNDSEIATHELFGPVAVAIPYRDTATAITLANSSAFGLNAAIWGPLDDCLDLAPRLRSGTVVVNGGAGTRADAPWGGFGDSGLGREGGEAGLAEFFEPKHVQWAL